MSTMKRLARAFAQRLLFDIGREALADVVEANRKEPNAAICHSHGFCDASETMGDAWVDVFGEEPRSPLCGDQAGVWHDAWTLARSQGFWLDEAHCAFFDDADAGADWGVSDDNWACGTLETET